MRPAVVALVLVGLMASEATAQDRRNRGRDRRSRPSIESAIDRNGIPVWENDPNFAADVFTFVRIRYNPRDGGRERGWSTDFPDADLNFSFRLQQLTSLKVNPNPIFLDLTDPRLLDYPFVYFVEPGGGRGGGSYGGGLNFSQDEAIALRRYLERGGFAMFDDFWGEEEWESFYREIKKVFPTREPIELPLEHPIFHMVYHMKEKPQIPSIQSARDGLGRGPGGTDITWERHDAQTVHFRAILDDKGRMMCIICHNTDLGDGWEREADDPWYFSEFSEKKAYPMGINILLYAMTH